MGNAKNIRSRKNHAPPSSCVWSVSECGKFPLCASLATSDHSPDAGLPLAKSMAAHYEPLVGGYLMQVSAGTCRRYRYL